MPNDGRFKPGQSGNPGGRPKAALPDGRTIAEVAREYSLTAIETLFDICTDPAAPHSAKRAAADSLIDRGWGQAKQAVELAGANGAPLPAIEIRLIQPEASGDSKGDTK